MRAGQALVRMLEAYGVDTVFGIPGTHSLELYRGLASSTIRHVSPRHEQGGGFMADGYARATGRPGVLFVISGPGVTNAATPIGEAFLDSVPMLIISPMNTPDPGKENRGRLHEITDQAAVTAPITAFSAVVNNTNDIPLLLARAFSVFASQRPRPVHISIPIPLLRSEIGPAWSAVVLPARPTAALGDLYACRDLLATAARPVILAGGGATRAAEKVVSLAEGISAPVITTVAGRGIIPASHRLCLGAQLGAAGAREVLANADVAVLLGTELAETDHFSEHLRLPRRQIRVNLNPAALAAPDTAIALPADVGHVAAGLAEICSPAPVQRQDWATKICAEVRASVRTGVNAKTKHHLAVLDLVMATVAENTLFVSDMTQLAYTAVNLLPLERPGCWLHPTGFGTLGYALPAAIGAKLSEPDRPVLAIAGDAGFQYTGQEMTLAAELGLAITLILWNNDRLLQIEEDMRDAGFKPLAVKQKNPDFELWARACGWRAERADNLAELKSCLPRGPEQTGTPRLINLNASEL